MIFVKMLMQKFTVNKIKLNEKGNDCHKGSYNDSNQYTL